MSTLNSLGLYSKRYAGYTLLELLVVLAMIALLTGIVVPVYMGRAEAAKIQKVESDFSTIATALRLYKFDNKMLPSTEQGLQALVNKPQRQPLPLRYKTGAYMRELPMDPWGRPYRYIMPARNNAKEFELYSLGADGKEGGEGSDSDIYG